MKRIALPLILLVVSLLAGCVAPVVRGSRLQEDAAPIRSLYVQLFSGDLEQFEGLRPSEIAAYRDVFATSLATRFPQILRTNGLSVPAFELYRGAMPNGPQFQNAPAKASHQLIVWMTGVAYSTHGGAISSSPSVRFSARLIDLSTKKIVWTSSPSLLIQPYQPNRQTELFAASIINGLADMRFIKLDAQYAVDVKGQPIENATIFHSDK